MFWVKLPFFIINNPRYIIEILNSQLIGKIKILNLSGHVKTQYYQKETSCKKIDLLIIRPRNIYAKYNKFDKEKSKITLLIMRKYIESKKILEIKKQTNSNLKIIFQKINYIMILVKKILNNLLKKLIIFKFNFAISQDLAKTIG